MTNTRTLPQIAKAIKALERKTVQNIVENGKLQNIADRVQDDPFENPWCTIPKSWACIDCGINTAPGIPIRAQVALAFAADFWNDQEPDDPSDDPSHIDNRARYRLQKMDAGKGEFIDFHISDLAEIYMVEPAVWKAAGMDDFGGCLCIGCLEKRLGRILTPEDFMRNHSFASFPGTKRLLARRDGDER